MLTGANAPVNISMIALAIDPVHDTFVAIAAPCLIIMVIGVLIIFLPPLLYPRGRSNLNDQFEQEMLEYSRKHAAWKSGDGPPPPPPAPPNCVCHSGPAGYYETRRDAIENKACDDRWRACLLEIATRNVTRNV